MPVDPYPGVPTPNTLADAAKMRSQLDALFSPTNPTCSAYHSIAQMFATSSSGVACALNSETYDNDGIHHLTTNNERLTCQTAGSYVVTGAVQWTAAAGGARYLAIRKNGSGAAIEAQDLRLPSASYGTLATTTAILRLAASDYVELIAWQDTGSNLSMLGAVFSMAFVSD